MPRDSRLYMTFPIDFHRHPKVARLSDAAFRAFVEANGESRIAESDGVIESDNAEFLWSKPALEELVTSHPSRPLMLRDGETYVIRDYAEHQFTTADKERLAEISRRNGAKGGRPRNPEKPAQVSTEPSTTQTKPGIGVGLGLPTPKGVGGATPYCSNHPNGTERPCGPCRTARLSFEAAQAEAKKKATLLPEVRRDETCTVHAEYPLPCPRCKEGT